MSIRKLFANEKRGSVMIFERRVCVMERIAFHGEKRPSKITAKASFSQPSRTRQRLSAFSQKRWAERTIPHRG